MPFRMCGDNASSPYIRLQDKHCPHFVKGKTEKWIGIAKVLNVSLDWLILGTNEKSTEAELTKAIIQHIDKFQNDPNPFVREILAIARSFPDDIPADKKDVILTTLRGLIEILKQHSGV